MLPEARASLVFNAAHETSALLGLMLAVVVNVGGGNMRKTSD